MNCSRCFRYDRVKGYPFCGGCLAVQKYVIEKPILTGFSIVGYVNAVARCGNCEGPIWEVEDYLCEECRKMEYEHKNSLSNH